MLKNLPRCPKSRFEFRREIILAVGLAVSGFLLAQQSSVRFLGYDQVRDLIADMASSGAPDVPGGDIKDGAAWERWIRSRDREIRGRIDRGVEDSISNLILYGTSYTQLPPLESFNEAASASGNLTQAAHARARALAMAITRPQGNERLRFVHDFLARRGIIRDSVEGCLSANLRRLVLEQRAYQGQLRAAGQTGDPEAVFFTRGTIFERRGLSVDTSLQPNLALEVTLEALARRNTTPAGCLHRIAVIGPGLDFADKRLGYDFYPVQTIQPFAILETTVRLGLAQPGNVRVVAFDLNPAVLAHLRRLQRQGRDGHPYIVQLPHDARAGWSPEMVSYWEHFGEFLGSPVRPLPVPTALKGVAMRAVAIRPQIAALVEAGDLDVVAETLEVPPGGGFDLVIATNVLVYYDFFQQALAMTSIARMMNRGGVFIANQVLSNQHPQALEFLTGRYVSYSAGAAYGDEVVVYRRR